MNYYCMKTKYIFQNDKSSNKNVKKEIYFSYDRIYWWIWIE